MNMDFKVISLWFPMSNFSIWISSLTPNLKQLSLKNNVQKCISYEKWFIHQNIHLRLIIVYWLVVNHVSKSLWPNRNNWFFFLLAYFYMKKNIKIVSGNIYHLFCFQNQGNPGFSQPFFLKHSQPVIHSSDLSVGSIFLNDSFDNEGK